MPKPSVELPPASNFSQDLSGKKVGLFHLRNSNNLQAAVSSYGARWVSMLLHDHQGQMTDVVVGFDSVAGYIGSTEAYYGATVGRYANRIAKGRFELDGQKHTLATNNPPNHLHGGVRGFHAVVWEMIESLDNSVTLQYVSPDGEEGFPGTLTAKVRYLLTEEDEMVITFEATTDRPTVVNLTNHAYFNLNGQGSGTILDHKLQINANAYTPIDETSIPTGMLEAVDGTPFDFREEVRIGERINEPSQQLTNGTGYDHNFVLDKAGDEYILAAGVTGDQSGIHMEVFTTEPGLQLYTGNFMNEENILKGGFKDGRRQAFCLETQHYPDSPNQKAFPSAVLRPGERYFTRTGFKFSTQGMAGV